jgi:hypothetical protein
MLLKLLKLVKSEEFDPHREGVVEELEEDSTLQESLHVIHNNLKKKC